MDEIYISEPIVYPLYARANGNGIVTYIFSTAFEQPLPSDVCIDAENDNPHKATEYLIKDDNGIFNYKLVNGELRERDKTEDMRLVEVQREINELKQWFDNYYSQHEQKYRRLEALDMELDDGRMPGEALDELYLEAERVRVRIQMLENLIQNGTNNCARVDG